jgi:hypothetical protein
MMNKSASSWVRPVSCAVSVSAAVIAGDLIREGSMSYAHAVGIVLISVVAVCALWGGAALWQKTKS